MQGIYKTSAAMCASSKIFPMDELLTYCIQMCLHQEVFTLQWQDYSPTFLSPPCLQKQTIPKY